MGSAFSIPLGIYTYMFEFSSRALIIIRFQQFLIQFITTALYPSLVVLGLILRSFPLTCRARPEGRGYFAFHLATHLDSSLPVTSLTFAKNAFLRSVLRPQFTGGHW